MNPSHSQEEGKLQDSSRRTETHFAKTHVLYLRVHGFLKGRTIDDIAKQFEEDTDGLPEKPQILESSFFQTTNARKPSFCGVAALESESHAAALIERLKPWEPDTEFIGITPIYQPTGHANADIIAVHGLLGHPIAAWKHNNEQSRTWLKDWLPRAFEADGLRANIFVYGYDTTKSASSCVELGSALWTAIRELRTRDDAKFIHRPIILIAHSLGGLVVKEAMLATSKHLDEVNSSILKSIYCVMFFGVPNRGLRHDVLISEVDGKPSEKLAQDLVVDEDQDPTTYLEQSSKSFGEKFSAINYKIDVFYEKQKSKVFELDDDGNRTDRSHMKRKVNKDSAELVGAPVGYCRHLDTDHTGLVRYPNQHQEPYTTVRDHLKQRVREAPSAISERLEVGDWGPADEEKTNKILDDLRFPEMDRRRQEIDKAAAVTFEWMLPDDTETSQDTDDYIGSNDEDEDEDEDEISESQDEDEYSESPNWDEYSKWQAEDEHSISRDEDEYPEVEDGDEHPACGLSQWLENGAGVFWICGKPGSGKSTLMKFIAQHSRTRNRLVQWAAGTPLVVTDHHFWYPGSHLQKSYEGLLRCLLHGLLSKHPKLTKRAFPGRWERSGSIFGLTTEDFGNALIHLCSADIKICLFIDGLDECYKEEDRKDIVGTLHRLIAFQNVKLCVSSRPWAIFEKAFSPLNMLRMEDVNRRDIRSYVGRLINTSAAKHDDFDEAEIKRLIADIVNGSSGVFLWAHLVTRVVSERLEARQKVKQIREHVEKFPRDLEFYFRDLVFGRIHPTWREHETPQALKLAMILSKNNDAPLLLFWWFLADQSSGGFQNANFGSLSQVRKLSKNDMLRMRDVTIQFLKQACQDLLQVHEDTLLGEDEDAGWFLNTNVRFLHRTVYDFLSSGETAELINKETRCLQQDSFLTQLYLAVAKLILPKTLWTAFPEHRRSYVFRDCFLDATLMNVLKLPETSRKAIVRECEGVALRYLEFRGPWTKSDDPELGCVPPWIVDDEALLISAFLSYGHSKYLTRKLQYGFKWVKDNALFSGLGMGKVEQLDFPVMKIDLQLVRTLLKYGYDPNDSTGSTGTDFRARKRSPWQAFLTKCFRETLAISDLGKNQEENDDQKSQRLLRISRLTSEEAEHMLKVVMLLLGHRASLDCTTCVTASRCVQDAGPGREYNFYIGHHKCQRLNTLDILRAVFGRENWPMLRSVVTASGSDWAEGSVIRVEAMQHSYATYCKRGLEVKWIPSTLWID